MKAIHLFYDILMDLNPRNEDQTNTAVERAINAAREINPKFKPSKSELSFAIKRVKDQQSFEDSF